MRKFKFKIGDKVFKIGGDYAFQGTVVAAFEKLNGTERYVVQNDEGILHIFGPSNLNSWTP